MTHLLVPGVHKSEVFLKFLHTAVPIAVFYVFQSEIKTMPFPVQITWSGPSQAR